MITFWKAGWNETNVQEWNKNGVEAFASQNVILKAQQVSNAEDASREKGGKMMTKSGDKKLELGASLQGWKSHLWKV